MKSPRLIFLLAGFVAQVSTSTITKRMTKKLLPFSGSKPIDSKTMTCNTLKRQGVYRSGIYPMKSQSDNFPHLSHCDFNHYGYDVPQMEQRIGYIDVTSEMGGVIFSVVKSKDSGDVTSGSYITYNKEVSNVGNHFDPSTGTFKAPKKGLYNFSFAAVTGKTGKTYVDLRVNGSYQFAMLVHNDEIYQNLSQSFQLHLKQNDEVRLYVDDGSVSTHDQIRLMGMLASEEF